MFKIFKDLRKINMYQVYLHVSLIMLASVVVILARQNSQLKAEPANSDFKSLKTGDYFSLDKLVPIEANQNFDGDTKQLLFVFNTKCGFCKLNLDNWSKIAQEARKQNVNIRGISLSPEEETIQYIKQNNIDFAVSIASNSDEFQSLNRIGGVPLSIIRDQDGQVEKVTSGLLSGDKVDEVVNALF